MNPRHELRLRSVRIQLQWGRVSVGVFSFTLFNLTLLVCVCVCCVCVRVVYECVLRAWVCGFRVGVGREG